MSDRNEVLQGIAKRFAADQGPDVPWHDCGYYPAYKFDTPTPVKTLEQAWRIGRDAGVPFVYLKCAGAPAGEHLLP